MRSGVLLGRDHPELGAVAAVAEGPVAIALSRGGARKRYDHQEPNEDAAAFGLGDAGALVAVADGHHGEYGAAIAVERALDRAASWLRGEPPPADVVAWHGVALDLVIEVDQAIIGRSMDSGLLPAPTTLSLALVRPDLGRLWHASVGDSHVFCVRGSTDAVEDVGFDPDAAGRPIYAGDGLGDGRDYADRVAAGCLPLAGLRALVLATDGLSEPGIGVDDPAARVADVAERSAHHASDLRALETARGVVDVAVEAHRRQKSGDNAASAVVWLDGALA